MDKLRRLKDSLKVYLTSLKEDLINLRISSFKDFLFNKKLLISFIVFVSIMGCITIVNIKSTKSSILKNLEVALKENNPRKIYKDIRINGNKIIKEEVEPLTEYYSENKAQVNSIIRSLKANGSSSFFSLVCDENLFFDDYYIEIEPVAIKVNTNFDNTKVYINNKKIANTNIKRNLIPGKYLIKGELETEYGVIEEEKEVYIMENTEYDLKIPAINISLTSNFSDASVYINGIKLNQKVSDIKNYGPIPLNKDITIQLEREFDWGVIKSEEVKVGTLPNINIDIDIINDTLIKNISDDCNTFYTSVFEALNNSDSSLILNCYEDTKSKIYDSIKKESLFLKNNYEFNDLKTELTKSEFFYEDGSYKGNVVISLNYTIKKQVLSFIKEDVEEMFLTQIQYNEGKWIVKDVQKFTIKTE